MCGGGLEIIAVYLSRAPRDIIVITFPPTACRNSASKRRIEHSVYTVLHESIARAYHIVRMGLHAG